MHTLHTVRTCISRAKAKAMGYTHTHTNSLVLALTYTTNERDGRRIIILLCGEYYISLIVISMLINQTTATKVHGMYARCFAIAIEWIWKQLFSMESSLHFDSNGTHRSATKQAQHFKRERTSYRIVSYIYKCVQCNWNVNFWLLTL